MASDKTLELSRRDRIKIADSVKGMGLGEPQYIGTYRKVVESVGKDEALRLYAGMSPEKSDFVCSCGEKMDMLSVRWTLDALHEIAANGGNIPETVKKKKKKKPAERRKSDPEPWDRDDRFYDYDYDDFYGPKDTVTYARWLFNRYGAEGIAEHFHVDKHFAWRLGNSDLPGGIKVASLEGSISEIEEIEERIEERHCAAFENQCNLEEFRKHGSRKLKVRMNRLMDYKEIFILKKLLEAEEFNITAKDCYYKYMDYNYGKKSERLLEAIGKLKETDWHYWWQDDEDGNASYIFYVELPGEIQVSWHGMDASDMKDVSKIKYKDWDGQMASTLPKIVECIKRLCPALMDEKFDQKKCRLQLDAFVAGLK